MPTVSSRFCASLRRHGKAVILDQTRLSRQEVWLELGDYRQVVTAIGEKWVRGAPAIGVAGAYARTRVAPQGIGVRNIALGITPHRYVTAIVTERGVAQGPCEESLLRLMGGSRG